MLGDYDFFFEWYKNPKRAEIDDLMRRIDEALAPLGCRYRMIIEK